MRAAILLEDTIEVTAINADGAHFQKGTVQGG